MPELLFSNVSRSNWSAADDADDEAKGHKKVVKCEASSVGPPPRRGHDLHQLLKADTAKYPACVFTSVNDSKSSNSSSASNSQTLMMMLAKESISKKHPLRPIFMSFFDYPFLKRGGRFVPMPQEWGGS